MFSKRFDPPASKSFSKSHRASKSTASFSKSHGITKTRHDPRRRLTTSISQHIDATVSPDGYENNSSSCHFMPLNIISTLTLSLHIVT